MPKELGIIFKRTSTAKLDRHVRSYLREYLDETFKHYLRARRPQYDPEKPEVRLIRGIDYHSYSSPGLITVHGHLRRAFHEECGKLPEACTKDETLRHLAAAIQNSAIKLGRATQGSDIAIKCVFALSPAVCQAWNQAGIDVDAGLRHVVNETMNRYRLHSMDGAELGYAIGIHHDKSHIHAHVFLMRHAANRKRLKLSNRLKNGEKGDIDHLDYLIGTANSVLREYQATFQRPKVKIETPRTTIADLNRWTTLAAYDRVPRGTAEQTTELLATKERERLQTGPVEELLGKMDLAYQKRLTALRQYKISATKAEGRAKLTADIQKLRRVIGEQENKVVQVRAKERSARKEKIAMLKAKQIELKLLNKALRISKRRRTPHAAKEIKEIGQILAHQGKINPTLRKLINERLQIAAGAANPFAQRSRADAFLDAQNRQGLVNWKRALDRQYTDLKKSVDQKIESRYTTTYSNEMQLTHLKSQIEIFEAALEARPCFVNHYQALMETPEVKFMRQAHPDTNVPAGQEKNIRPSPYSIRPLAR